MSRAAVLALALLVVVGCGPTAEEEGAAAADSAAGVEATVDEVVAECVAPPAGASLDAMASLSDAAGEWSVTIVADEGATAGARQEAAMTLSFHELDMQTLVGISGEPIPNASAPLYGSIDLDPETLGAFPTDGLDSTDPDAPGVGVYETRAADDSGSPSIILRLGSEANRRGSTAIDPASTALRVVQITDAGFSGTWQSTSNAQTRAAGYFCAYRPVEGFGE